MPLTDEARAKIRRMLEAKTWTHEQIASAVGCHAITVSKFASALGITTKHSEDLKIAYVSGRAGVGAGTLQVHPSWAVSAAGAFGFSGKLKRSREPIRLRAPQPRPEMVTPPGAERTSKAKPPPKIKPPKLTPTQRQLLDLAKSSPGIGRAEAASRLNTRPKAVSEDMAELQKLGLLRVAGAELWLTEPPLEIP